MDKLEECTGCIGSTKEHTCQGWDDFQQIKAMREGSKGMPAAEFEIDRLQKRVATLNTEIERLTADLKCAREGLYEVVEQRNTLLTEVSAQKHVIELLIGFAPIDMHKFIEMLEAYGVEVDSASGRP